ncbi:type I restriction enzyme endonuclease domain-containing protein [Burkholderia sp. ZZQ-2]|uniref:type I restriction enzyme endonuclease domain-containing protein n=1 Tax=Burkholderia sp. ZZQ-2 TaxID=1661766 RepID=UPI003D6DAAD6
MNSRQQPGEIRMIPVSQIEVINPRERNGRVFNEIVDNIKTIGLKKPILVTPRVTAAGIEKYLLVCGEGRLKAFRTLPAVANHVLGQDDGKKRFADTVLAASKAFALCCTLAEALAYRDELSG